MLRFFREGADAFTMIRAQGHFNLGAEALIARLARAGVTVAEAWAGAMPDPAVLWQRVRGRAAAQGAVVAQQEVSAGDFGGLLASLERWPGSPTAERDTAGSRKRVAGTPVEGESSGVRPRREPSPHRDSDTDEDVLMDPGTPRSDDLAALDVGLERTRTGEVGLARLSRGPLPDARRGRR